MTATTLITERQTTTSATVSVPAGARYTFGLFTTNANGVPPAAHASLSSTAPTGTRHFYSLRGCEKPMGVDGPVDVTVVLPDLSYHGINVGVYYHS